MAMMELSKWAKANHKDPALARQKAQRGTVPAVKVGRSWMIEETTPWEAATLSLVKVHVAKGLFLLSYAGETHTCIRDRGKDEIPQIASFVASIIKCKVIKIKCDLYESGKLDLLEEELRKYYDAVNLSYLDEPVMDGVDNQGLIYVGEYLHYNQIVWLFQKDVRSFTGVLRENQMTYEQLSITRPDVVRFSYKNKTVYACAKSLTWSNIIYFTDTYPADGDWECLMKDIWNQNKSDSEPMEMPSKAARIIEYATKMMRKYIPVERSNKNPGSYEMTEKELSLVKDMINGMDYRVEDLFEMDHHDIDESLLKAILECDSSLDTRS